MPGVLITLPHTLEAAPFFYWTVYDQHVHVWYDQIATFLGIDQGWPLVVSWLVDIIAAALLTRVIMQRLLRGGSNGQAIIEI